MAEDAHTTETSRRLHTLVINPNCIAPRRKDVNPGDRVNIKNRSGQPYAHLDFASHGRDPFEAKLGVYTVEGDYPWNVDKSASGEYAYTAICNDESALKRPRDASGQQEPEVLGPPVMRVGSHLTKAKRKTVVINKRCCTRCKIKLDPGEEVGLKNQSKQNYAYFDFRPYGRDPFESAEGVYTVEDEYPVTVKQNADADYQYDVYCNNSGDPDDKPDTPNKGCCPDRTPPVMRVGSREKKRDA